MGSERVQRPPGPPVSPPERHKEAADEEAGKAGKGATADTKGTIFCENTIESCAVKIHMRCVMHQSINYHANTTEFNVLCS